MSKRSQTFIVLAYLLPFFFAAVLVKPTTSVATLTGTITYSQVSNFTNGVQTVTTNTAWPIFTVDNIRLDANTLTTTNGNLTLQSASGAVHLNGAVTTNSGDFYVGGISVLNNDAYFNGTAFFNGSAELNGQELKLEGGDITGINGAYINSIAANVSGTIGVDSPILFNAPLTNNSTSYFADIVRFNAAAYAPSHVILSNAPTLTVHAANKDYVDLSAASKMFWRGTVYTNLSTPEIAARAGTVYRAFAKVTTAPTGSDLLVDIRIGGASVFSNSGGYLRVTAGSNQSSNWIYALPASNSFITFATISAHVTQVGSTIPGEDVAVIIQYQ